MQRGYMEENDRNSFAYNSSTFWEILVTKVLYKIRARHEQNNIISKHFKEKKNTFFFFLETSLRSDNYIVLSAGLLRG